MPASPEPHGLLDGTDPGPEVAAWAASGAMALTGWPAAPLGPPAGLIPELRSIGEVLARRSRALGREVDVDPVALLGERAAVAGLHRQGRVSCGGATRLLPGRDGWLAVSLARPEDRELVPAWLEDPSAEGDGWDAVARAARRAPVAASVDRGILLGLPVAALPPRPPAFPAPGAGLPLRAVRLGAPTPPRPIAGARVVDLSSLWAGPLCGSLLAAAGADVVKVESTTRPDGARGGPPALFDLLNAGKRSVAIDLRDAAGVRALRALVAGADVVVESSRPRALEHLGIDAEALLTGTGPQVWASITGHGRGAGRERVAFGDDAAVAGGLVVWDGGGPCFCADAVADPVSGLVAATAVLESLGAGGRWLLDVSMAGVAAHLAGPTLPTDGAPSPVRPSARPAPGRGPALGEHTREVLAELELS